MALGCLTCVKYTLLVFNFIFWLVGCLLLAFGIWALVDPGPVREHASDLEWEASILVYVTITIGSIMTIVGFLGCCGAIRESRCLLTTFFILLFLIHGIFISVGIFLMVKRERLSEWFPPPKKEMTSNRLKALLAELENDPSSRIYMAEIQSEYNCCGADRGEADYINIQPPYPQLICKKRFARKPCTDVVWKAESERYNLRMKELPRYVLIAASVVLSVSGLMILGMILTLVLCCAFKRESINNY